MKKKSLGKLRNFHSMQGRENCFLNLNTEEKIANLSYNGLSTTLNYILTSIGSIYFHAEHCEQETDRQVALWSGCQ